MTSNNTNNTNNNTNVTSKSTRKRVFLYHWNIDKNEPEITAIRIYCLDENNKNVCLRVDNFLPYCYCELPTNINWESGYSQLVGNKLDELLQNKKPIQKALMYKERLYGAYLDQNYERKEFPYLFCAFSNREEIKNMTYQLRKPINVPVVGSIRLKVHESDADPILQLASCRNIPTAGWIEFVGKEVVNEDSKVTLCDKEYCVSYKNLFPYNCDKMPDPKIMVIDAEVNSTNVNAMPNADRPGDKLFQISACVGRSTQVPDTYTKYILSLGWPDEKFLPSDILVKRYETEADLLLGFRDLVREENPNIISGYNVFLFDFPYMYNRAKLNLCIFNFDQLGFHKYNHAKLEKIAWSSSAYKNQQFHYPDAEGRLIIDLLPLIKRDFKLNVYKLNSIAEHLGIGTKVSLSVKGIFKCYRIGTKKDKNGEYSRIARKAMSIVGIYCVFDSLLVGRLLRELNTFIGLAEMAKVCNVPMFTLFTQGQQIKVYSQVFKHCMYKGIVVEKDAYQVREDERYMGAHVFPPVPGVYRSVVPLDFSSLYPSIMIAYNVDYNSWIRDDSADIPDEMCHIHSWSDHSGCQHDPKVIRKNELSAFIEVEQKKIKELREIKKKTSKKDKDTIEDLTKQINELVNQLKPYTKERSDITKTLTKHVMCAERYYRFLKEPMGVLPSVVKGLLDSRASTRKKQKDVLAEIDSLREVLKINQNNQEIQAKIKDLKIFWEILEKRQLAYKVSANSAYGAMGVRKGYLPFMPGAMVVTYKGRVNINIVAKTIPEKYGGHLVYGDSVSADTPVLCRLNGKLEYRTISDLPCCNYRSYRSGKQQAYPDHSLQVWTEQGFTDIKRIIRHKTKKTMYRVATKTGVVDVTEDHGLLDKNASKISPTEVTNKTELLTTSLPSLLFFKPTNINMTASTAFYLGIRSGVYGDPIPNEILTSSYSIRQTFFDAYTGDFEFDYHTLYFKDKLQASKVYYLATHLGYSVSLNYAGILSTTYVLYLSKNEFIQHENKVVRMNVLGPLDEDEYVYDLETENHHFSAGIGKLIVHNTDSNYVNFPMLKTPAEIWDHALFVAKEISNMFPPPMKLEFEMVVYWFFFILTKKRYMYRSCKRDGIVDRKIGKKGVLLSRRDNSKFVRDVYEHVIEMIADDMSKEDIFYYVISELNLLCSHSKPTSDFIITKSVGDIGDLIPEPFVNEKGKLKAKIGDYTVPILDEDEQIRAKQLAKKGADSEEEFYLLCLPAQVQLAERMRRRGLRVDPGTRLEYIVSDPENHTAKQYQKVESAEYLSKHGGIIAIDYLYYIKALSTPLDQVLSVIFQEEKDFVLSQYKYRWQVRKKVIDEINSLGKPKILVE